MQWKLMMHEDNIDKLLRYIYGLKEVKTKDRKNNIC